VGKRENMKKILLIVCRFVYRVSGLRAFVSMIESRILHYRLCIRMVPFSYKLFVWSLGVVTGASGLYLFPVLREAFVGENVIVYQVQSENVPQIKNEPVPVIWEEAVFTSYSAGDGYTPGTVMASGKIVYVGAVACPRSMRLGTVIELEDGRALTCEDRKALRFDGEFDIYASTVDEAIQFGRKTVKFKIVR